MNLVRIERDAVVEVIRASRLPDNQTIDRGEVLVKMQARRLSGVVSPRSDAERVAVRTSSG